MDVVQVHLAEPIISARHLEAALSATKPSLPSQEQERMNRIYTKFRRSREAGVGNKDVKGKGLRTTLA